MRLKKIKNNSNEDVQLKHINGAKTTLPPRAELRDVEITNLDEIKDNVKTIIDLTEVVEVPGKTRLNS